jgi:hypothetical protein
MAIESGVPRALTALDLGSMINAGAMKNFNRWITGLSVALPIAACLVFFVMQRREIDRLSAQNDSLTRDRKLLAIELERARLQAETSPAAAGGEIASLPSDAASNELTEADEANANPDRDALMAEVTALREELETWRGIPGETGRLLGILSNAEAGTEKRKNAVLELLGQCDILAHAGELIDAFRNETDPEVRRQMREVMPQLAAKFRSLALADAVMEDMVDGGDGNACASMLAQVHGSEGIDEIRSYLSDGSPEVRRAAIQAIGQKLPKSDAVVSTLFAAEASADPNVRARASFYLANNDESYSYDGMIDDWRTLFFSMRAEDFASISTPAEKIFAGLSPRETADVMDLVGDLGQFHQDENVRRFMEAVHRKLREDGVGAR